MSTPRKIAVDTAVLAYALGGEHVRRDACRAVVEAAGRGEVELHASTELVQELVFHRMRRLGGTTAARTDAVQVGRDVMELCVLHPLDDRVLSRALDIVLRTPLGGRDAVHAATAMLHGFDAFVTPDRDFDAVPGLARLDPADALR